MTQLTAWSPFFPSKARMRGRALQLGQKVTRLEPAEDELVRAEVEGESVVTVSVKSDGRRAIIESDSPQAAEGVFCEHIWATLLHLVHDSSGPGASVEEVIKLKPQPPKAKKRIGAPRAVGSSEPQWMGRLALMRPSAADIEEETSGVFPVQRRVCYAVVPRLSARHNGLVIELRQRTATVTGWGRPKPMKISPETVKAMSDPADREICSLLLGANWVNEHEATDGFGLGRTHAIYRVAGNAQRRLLRQMIATGRCAIDTGDEFDQGVEPKPLAWDAQEEGTPWQLFLHGVVEEDEAAPPELEEDDALAELARRSPDLFEGDDEDEPGESAPAPEPEPRDLLIDVQMRRGGHRVAIEQPELILGGADGLVIYEGKASTFDDREAWRWVSQFRDDRFEDDATGRTVMRIPAGDVDRFLDRLYMLPHLPELDLPEGLGRTEQTLEPVPHIDLHSPNSVPAMELAASTAKNHLVARLWFSYGEQRVSPVQTGRFVPVSTAVDGEPPSAEGTPADKQDTQAAEPQDGEMAAEVAPQEAGNDPASPPVEEDDPSTARLIRRNRRAERKSIQQCATLGLRHIASPSGDTLLLPLRLMPNAISELLNAGWSVAADQQVVRTAGPPALSITSGIDWFELRGSVKFAGEDGTDYEVSLPEVLAAARAGRNMVELGDGSQGLLPQQWLEDHGLLTALGQVQDDHLRFGMSQAAMLDALLDERDLISIDETFAQARKELQAFDGVEPLEPSIEFMGKLRSYQRRGLGWFGFLRRFGMGGILADDMGLGKTIQVLAMIQARILREEGYTDHGKVPEQGNGPSLIVVPRSVVFNWIDEAKKFTPELKILMYTGPDREHLREQFDQCDMVVMSYGLMRRDIEALRDVNFDYVILDEAQAIKNGQSQSAKAARLLRGRHRLALTGTPIENHLGDLWSIFEFLNPGMLGSNARFADLIRGATRGRVQPAMRQLSDANVAATAPGFDPDSSEAAQAADAAASSGKTGDSAQRSKDALVQVAAALRPFILRRTKQQVLTDLPAKTEQTIICEMAPAQRKIYDQLRAYYRGNLLKQLDAPGSGAVAASGAKGRGLGRSAFMVLEALLRLRQAACHPALIDKTAAAGAMGTLDAPSAKLDELDQRLDEIIDEGSKALVFSQFTSMLALIRKRLDERGINYAYLDGQTRNRKDVVERFQSDPDLQVFLISLKAGGVGLNLTAAEYVFIMDPWWNPAVEAQAIDRTHRIGQKKPVFAYRLICEDTVEQRILELQGRKRDLAEAIVGGQENLIANLTREDLERLLS